MIKKKVIELEIPINRVEGDLDIKVKIEDNKIIDAKSVGTLYRGFENILIGKDVLDALVITPRVCGICSVSHLLAATKAIENAFDIIPPAQAVRLRNLSTMAETTQSDIRQNFLMFLPDFANEYYQNENFYEEAIKLYEPFKGEMGRETLNATKEILKIVAMIGGQWPHTSHMVPGGISTIPTDSNLLSIKNYIKNFKRWYEKKVLHSTIENFNTLKNFNELETFCEKNPTSQIAIFTKIAKQTNLFNIGSTDYGHISYGSVEDPINPNNFLLPSGFLEHNTYKEFDQKNIKEDAKYSWYIENKPLHPFVGETKTNYQKEFAYSWAKAPRYENKVTQTGPLSDALIAKDKLITDIVSKFNDSVYPRQLARLLRPIKYINLMEKMIDEVLQNVGTPMYINPGKLQNGKGYGLTQAARGALGHWIDIKDGIIQRYQIISPTSWNGSPKDSNENNGPWEKALYGLEIKNTDHPMPMGHVIRSFDPCLVCTVHSIDKNTTSKLKIGI